MRPSLEALEAQTWWHGGPHRLTDIAYNHPRHGGCTWARCAKPNTAARS